MIRGQEIEGNADGERINDAKLISNIGGLFNILAALSMVTKKLIKE